MKANEVSALETHICIHDLHSRIFTLTGGDGLTELDNGLENIPV